MGEPTLGSEGDHAGWFSLSPGRPATEKKEGRENAGEIRTNSKGAVSHMGWTAQKEPIRCGKN